MEFLKHYFAADHRMNRKPYIWVLIVYMVVSVGISSVVMMSGQMSDMMKTTMDLVQEKAAKKITEEEYQARVTQMQLDASHNISPTISALGIVFNLLFLPSLAMRLKDLNYSPMPSLLFLSCRS